MVLDLAQEARKRALARDTDQGYPISLHDHELKNHKYDDHTLSIDEVLKELRTGSVTNVEERMGLILNELKPIFTLMTDEEKERLITKIQ